MKKITIYLLTIAVMLSFISCSSNKFEVLECGDFDYVSGAKHSKDIDIEDAYLTKENATLKKEIKFNNIDYQVEYRQTKESCLYQNNINYYAKQDNSSLVEFGINNDTKKMDFYSYLSKNYLEDIDQIELTRNECFKIAEEYFKNAAGINISEYSLVEERTWSSPEFSTVYVFSFMRLIDGVETGDTAVISITVFGDVIGHTFGLLGAMKGATLPSESDIKLIEENVDKKLQNIYSNVTDKYSVSYEIPDPLFIRMADGRYAFEYFVEVDLTPKDDTEHTISEVTKLLVYVD